MRAHPSRRALILAPLLLGLAPCLSAGPARAATLSTGFTPTPQDAADLARVAAYLNAITTLKARFLQVAPDGNVSQGTAWIERPGRMRFAYDPPAPYLLVAGHGLVVFHDSKLGQTSNIPIGQTPLGILLARKIVLSGPVTVTGVKRLPGEITVSLLRTANPGAGRLVLTFATAPLVLRQWSVFDAQDQETRVTLFNIETGGSFDPKLFDYVDPKFFQSRPSGG
ncbi:MAG: outer membrane lipoprotein carrier protein LolA [Rhodospirillales bacterium]|nr:outer membrane lipoprotein carrier protein LolA [Rhodospirillales bacterium]